MYHRIQNVPYLKQLCLMTDQHSLLAPDAFRDRHVSEMFLMLAYLLLHTGNDDMLCLLKTFICVTCTFCVMFQLYAHNYTHFICC